MVSSLDHAFIIIFILFLKIPELCICACARAEYEIKGECCPMCPSGSRVFRHCTEVISTTCTQCLGSTYTDEPNGLSSCLSCTVCEAAQGLRVKTTCTQTSDAVCESLEGFYCTDENMGGCRYAVKHKKCSSGQYIKQKGTALTDTECAVCTDGTYSNGSLEMCKPHLKCEDLGLTEIKPGTNSLDAECGKKYPVIAGVIAGVLTIVLAVAGALLFVMGRRKCLHRDEFTKTSGYIHQSDTRKKTRKGLSTLKGEDRMDGFALNQSGHVAVNDCENQPCDPQENEFTLTEDET